MSDSTRMSAVNSDLSSNLEERMQSPQNLQGQQDGKALVSSRKCGIALSFSCSVPSFSTCCVLFFIVCNLKYMFPMSQHEDNEVGFFFRLIYLLLRQQVNV